MGKSSVLRPGVVAAARSCQAHRRGAEPTAQHQKPSDDYHDHKRKYNLVPDNTYHVRAAAWADSTDDSLHSHRKLGTEYSKATFLQLNATRAAMLWSHRVTANPLDCGSLGQKCNAKQVRLQSKEKRFGAE